MLKRLFLSTLAVGVICTLVLVWLSPDVQRQLSRGAKFDLGFVSLPWLTVFIPVGLALFSRIIKLHDRLSDLLGLRERIDVDQILLPLAKGTGVALSADSRERLVKHRHKLMKNAFYKYAPDANDPSINKQYVADALDKWGWFWCFLEASVVVLFAAPVALVVATPAAAVAFLIVAVLIIVVAAS